MRYETTYEQPGSIKPQWKSFMRSVGAVSLSTVASLVTLATAEVNNSEPILILLKGQRSPCQDSMVAALLTSRVATTARVPCRRPLDPISRLRRREPLRQHLQKPAQGRARAIALA